MSEEFSNKLNFISNKYITVGYWQSLKDITVNDTKFYLLLIKNGDDLDLMYARYDKEINRWYSRNSTAFVNDECILLISYIDTDSLKERLVPCPF